MTQDQINNLRRFLMADDLEALALGNGIITSNLTNEQVKEFLQDLNSSQNKYIFKTKKGIGIYRINK